MANPTSAADKSDISLTMSDQRLSGKVERKSEVGQKGRYAMQDASKIDFLGMAEIVQSSNDELKKIAGEMQEAYNKLTGLPKDEFDVDLRRKNSKQIFETVQANMSATAIEHAHDLLKGYSKMIALVSEDPSNQGPLKNADTLRTLINLASIDAGKNVRVKGVKERAESLLKKLMTTMKMYNGADSSSAVVDRGVNRVLFGGDNLIDAVSVMLSGQDLSAFNPKEVTDLAADIEARFGGELGKEIRSMVLGNIQNILGGTWSDDNLSRASSTDKAALESLRSKITKKIQTEVQKEIKSELDTNITGISDTEKARRTAQADLINEELRLLSAMFLAGDKAKSKDATLKYLEYFLKREVQDHAEDRLIAQAQETASLLEAAKDSEAPAAISIDKALLEDPSNVTKNARYLLWMAADIVRAANNRTDTQPAIVRKSELLARIKDEIIKTWRGSDTNRAGLDPESSVTVKISIGASGEQEISLADLTRLNADSSLKPTGQIIGGVEEYKNGTYGSFETLIKATQAQMHTERAEAIERSKATAFAARDAITDRLGSLVEDSSKDPDKFNFANLPGLNANSTDFTEEQAKSIREALKDVQNWTLVIPGHKSEDYSTLIATLGQAIDNRKESLETAKEERIENKIERESILGDQLKEAQIMANALIHKMVMQFGNGTGKLGNPGLKKVIDEVLNDSIVQRERTAANNRADATASQIKPAYAIIAEKEHEEILTQLGGAKLASNKDINAIIEALGLATATPGVSASDSAKAVPAKTAAQNFIEAINNFARSNTGYSLGIEDTERDTFRKDANLETDQAKAKALRAEQTLILLKQLKAVTANDDLQAKFEGAFSGYASLSGDLANFKSNIGNESTEKAINHLDAAVLAYTDAETKSSVDSDLARDLGSDKKYKTDVVQEAMSHAFRQMNLLFGRMGLHEDGYQQIYKDREEAVKNAMSGKNDYQKALATGIEELQTARLKMSKLGSSSSDDSSKSSKAESAEKSTASVA